MAAERAAGAVEDGAVAVAQAAVAAQEAALALAGEEAEVLALGLAGDRRGRGAAAISRTSGLVSSVSGKPSRPSSSGGSAASM